MATTRDPQLGVRIDDELLTRIDAHRERLATPGSRVTRSDAVRNALERGLAEAERKRGIVRGDSGRGTKRGE